MPKRIKDPLPRKSMNQTLVTKANPLLKVKHTHYVFLIFLLVILYNHLKIMTNQKLTESKPYAKTNPRPSIQKEKQVNVDEQRQRRQPGYKWHFEEQLSCILRL